MLMPSLGYLQPSRSRCGLDSGYAAVQDTSECDFSVDSLYVHHAARSSLWPLLALLPSLSGPARQLGLQIAKMNSSATGRRATIQPSYSGPPWVIGLSRI